MTKSKPTYEALNSELEAIIATLQQDDTDIDCAVTQYKRGLEVLDQLHTHITEATNTIEELKASFSAK